MEEGRGSLQGKSVLFVYPYESLFSVRSKSPSTASHSDKPSLSKFIEEKEELKRLEAQGKHKYEYDSDEETEGGTWEHKLRSAEMEATQMWAEELTAQAEGKHHIGDFLPPDELDKFMEQYNAVKEGREPNLGDYKEYKLKEDNIGACNKNLTTCYTSLGKAPFDK